MRGERFIEGRSRLTATGRLIGTAVLIGVASWAIVLSIGLFIGEHLPRMAGWGLLQGLASGLAWTVGGTSLWVGAGAGLSAGLTAALPRVALAALQMGSPVLVAQWLGFFGTFLAHVLTGSLVGGLATGLRPPPTGWPLARLAGLSDPLRTGAAAGVAAIVPWAAFVLGEVGSVPFGVTLFGLLWVAGLALLAAGAGGLAGAGGARLGRWCRR